MAKRIAILSDIHGNSVALRALLADVELCGGVDAYWVLGDLVALGPDPVGVLEQLSSLPNLRVVRGNTDRYVCTGDRPPPTLEQARADPDLLSVLTDVAGTFAWTLGAVTQAGWLQWLAGLPLELRMTLPDGTRVLGVHAVPGSDGEPGIGIHPGLGKAELHALLLGCEADLILVGHTHVPMEDHVGGKHIVNVGGVSNPLPPDLRASYAILTSSETGYQIEHRRVDYERAAVIRALEQMRHPGAGFIVRHMRGEIGADP
jgi:predicted phosphodiesterase